MIRAFFILLVSCVTLRAGAPVMYFPTTNQLVAFKIPGGQTSRLVCWVSGMSTTNTIDGGVFVYDSTSTATLDGYNIFKPTLDNGRWIRNGLSLESVPTWRGKHTFTQSPPRFTFSNDGDTAWESYVTGDSVASIFMTGNGSFFWGTGAASVDVAFSRTGVGLMEITGDLDISGLTASRVLGSDSTGKIVSLAAPAVDGYVLSSTIAGVKSWIASSGSGTVTSVALTAPSFINVAGSPVTTSGTLALTFANQDANTGLLGPTSGGAAAPTFRGFVSADIQDLVANWTAQQTFELGNVDFRNTAAYSTTPSTLLKGSVKYNAAGTYSTVAQMTIGKENATDGDNAGFWIVSTRANGGSMTEKVRVKSDGQIVVSQFTASRYLKSDASKNISTTDTETANTVFAGPTSGGAAVPAFRALTAEDFGGTGSGVSTVTTTDATLTTIRTITPANRTLIVIKWTGLAVNRSSPPMVHAVTVISTYLKDHAGTLTDLTDTVTTTKGNQFNYLFTDVVSGGNILFKVQNNSADGLTVDWKVEAITTLLTN